MFFAAMQMVAFGRFWHQPDLQRCPRCGRFRGL